MASLPDFTRRQYAFAANIRDPENNPAPDDIEDRRMQIYRELFYNNVESFISGTFPVLRRIYSDADWHALVREYFSRHRSRTPLFHEIPREFLNWGQQKLGYFKQEVKRLGRRNRARINQLYKPALPVASKTTDYGP